MKLSTLALRLLNISIIALVWILVILLLYRLGLRAFDFGYRMYTEPAVATEENGRDILVTINDTAYGTVAESLYEKGLVQDKLLFEMQLRLAQFGVKKGEGIQPGVYTLNTSMDYQELIAVMSGRAETEEETEEL